GLVPHLTIVLDIEPEAAAERMGKRGQSNYLDEENQQFHQRVRQTYLSRAHKEPDRYVVLDASVGADELTERILEAIRRRLPQTLAGRDSTTAEAALADTGGASETDDSAAGDATAAGSAAAGAAAAGATAEGEDAADSGSSAARADPADDHGSADADSPADDDPATDEGSEPSDSAAAESPSAGEDSRHERGPRFVPVSGDRLIPESITDDEVEISGGVPTERVDLGANLREEPSASEGEDAGDLPSFLDSKDEPESDEEASTTVLPARGFTSGPLIDDTDDAEGVPTDRIETDSAEEAETRVVDHVDPEEAETRGVDHVDPEEAETRGVEPRASDDEIDPGDAETTVRAREALPRDLSSTTLTMPRACRQTGSRRIRPKKPKPESSITWIRRRPRPESSITWIRRRPRPESSNLVLRTMRSIRATPRRLSCRPAALER